MENIILEYLVPFEQKSINDDFFIEGIAINETTTANGHVFLGEELAKSAHTMIGRPVLKDHNNSVDSIVGIVKDAGFNQMNRNVPFKALIRDKKMQQLIKDKLLNSVSVGAYVEPKDVEELENGNIIPHNIQFKELSLVAVPADANATFSIAFNNAFNNAMSKCPECGKMIEKSKMKDHMTKMHEVEDKLQSNIKFENTERRNITMSEEEKIVESQVKETETKVTETLLESRVKALEDKMAKLETVKVTEKPVEEKVEVKAEAESVDESGNYNIVEGHKSFSYERKSYNY